ncbi:c-type cytochrome [Oceanibium sediminis]|uniref:c-type cytochrome n=1 Tax=Oceanibium sediminis TaxID=2026339 RepID=UPI000DD3BD0B|nr:c-type cytochrome [Oceanibium sediminis]
MRLACLSLSVAASVLCTTVAADTFGDPVAGEVVFANCKACHKVGPEAGNGIGPHLNGLFGRAAAGLEGFRYSRSLQRAGSNGLEWHADTLDAFLEDPRGYASGTRMSFRGLKDQEERLDVIAYLRGFSADPANFPEADPTATATDHDIDPEILAIEGDAEYGEYLSSECTTCHRADGGDDGIPSIVLWPEQDFKIALQAYKNEQRSHPVMQMIARRLNDEEIAALAAYFGSLEN